MPGVSSSHEARNGASMQSTASALSTLPLGRRLPRLSKRTFESWRLSRGQHLRDTVAERCRSTTSGGCSALGRALRLRRSCNRSFFVRSVQVSSRIHIQGRSRSPPDPISQRDVRPIFPGLVPPVGLRPPFSTSPGNIRRCGNMGVQFFMSPDTLTLIVGLSHLDCRAAPLVDVERTRYRHG